MPIRITNIEKDIPLLNKALQQLEVAQSNIAKLQQHVATLQTQGNTQDNRLSTRYQDNSVFTWTGSSHTLSWPAFYLRNVPLQTSDTVTAGSLTGLTASTNYWLSWNVAQQRMQIATSLATLSAIPNSIVVVQLFTGTAGQSGHAGGGGTAPGGSAITGLSYKLF